MKQSQGVEIQRTNGEDIGGVLEPYGWDERTYELILDLKGIESAEEYKDSCEINTFQESRGPRSN